MIYDKYYFMLISEDFEIYKLKKKLEETEEAMNRIMKHMGAMSACLSGMDKNFPAKENSDVRVRHFFLFK